MRIGFFTDSYLPRADGIANGVEAYRAGLEALGHEVYVFCPQQPEPFIEPTNRIYRFRSIPSIWYENYRDTFPFSSKRITFIKSLQLDLIHTFTQAQIGLFGTYMARQTKIPLVTMCMVDFDLIKEYRRLGFFSFVGALGASFVTNHPLSRHELISMIKPEYPIDPWLQRLIKTAAAFYNNQCDVITAPSIKVKKAIEPYMKKKVVVIPNGTDTHLVPTKPDITKIRKQYGLPHDITLFISTCRLVIEKRVDFLIQAYAQLSEVDKEKSALIIVGDGPEMNNLKNLVEKLYLKEKVFFIGLLKYKQVLEITSACDIYIHACLRETQGLVLNEAAACGKPIIMIDREVNPVLKDGENGLFSNNTITDFSSKMNKLLHNKDLRLKYGATGKKLAEATSQENVSKMLEYVYKDLLQRNF